VGKVIADLFARWRVGWTFVFAQNGRRSAFDDRLMGHRRQADRAEAIVKGVGAIIMLLVLLVMVRGLPQILKGKDTGDAIGTMLQMIIWFAMLGGLVVVVGLIVWFKVQKAAKKRGISKGSTGRE
jgi:protein-S-isoprenylcysteine O-methyltransferase Ste14